MSAPATETLSHRVSERSFLLAALILAAGLVFHSLFVLPPLVADYIPVDEVVFLILALASLLLGVGVALVGLTTFSLSSDVRRPAIPWLGLGAVLWVWFAIAMAVFQFLGYFSHSMLLLILLVVIPAAAFTALVAVTTYSTGRRWHGTGRLMGMFAGSLFALVIGILLGGLVGILITVGAFGGLTATAYGLWDTVSAH